MSDTAGRKRSREGSERNWPQWVLQSSVEEFQTMFQLYGKEGFLWLFQVLGFHSVLRVIAKAYPSPCTGFVEKVVFMFLHQSTVPHISLHVDAKSLHNLFLLCHWSVWYPLFHLNEEQPFRFITLIAARRLGGHTIFHLYAQIKQGKDFYEENLVKLCMLAKKANFHWIRMVNNHLHTPMDAALCWQNARFLACVQQIHPNIKCSGINPMGDSWWFPMEFYLFNSNAILDRRFLRFLTLTFPFLRKGFNYEHVREPARLRKLLAYVAQGRFHPNSEAHKEIVAGVRKEWILAAITDTGTLADAIRGKLITVVDYWYARKFDVKEFATQETPFHQYMMTASYQVRMRSKKYAPLCRTPAIRRLCLQAGSHKTFYHGLTIGSLVVCQVLQTTLPTPFVFPGALRHFQGPQHAEFRAWLLRYRRWKPRVDVTDWFPPQFRDEARQLLVLCARNGRVPRDIQRLLVETLADMYIADFDVILGN